MTILKKEKYRLYNSTNAAFLRQTPVIVFQNTSHLSATLASTTDFGGTFQGQFIRPPGNLLKSNWQHIFGSGPQV